MVGDLVVDAAGSKPLHPLVYFKRYVQRSERNDQEPRPLLAHLLKCFPARWEGISHDISPCNVTQKDQQADAQPFGEQDNDFAAALVKPPFESLPHLSHEPT